VTLQERTAQVGGYEIQYREGGTGEPVVMLHGAGGFRQDTRAFEGVAARFRLLVPSMPGFDESTPGEVKDTPGMAQVMAEFIRQVVGGAAHVVGESFGGGVSSWLAIRHPELVSRLVLAAPAGLRQEGGASPAALSPQDAAILLYGTPPTVQPSPAEAERRAHNRHNAGRISSARPAFDSELLALLPQIKAPTLVLWGTADRMILPSQAPYFVDNIPDARLVTIEGAPHVLAAAVPDAFLREVLPFLAGETGTRYTEATSRATG
jgi:pimeloyl-ACP methyl ester carboxylesterase